MAGIELCKFTHGLGLYTFVRGVKSKKIKAQPMCKFAQLYACHELFLKCHAKHETENLQMDI